MYYSQNSEVKFQKTVFKSAVWLTSEIWLTFLGIDNFADYCEFLLEKQRHINHQDFTPIKSAKIHPKFCHKISANCPVLEIMISSKSADYYHHLNSSDIFAQKCLKIRRSCLKAELIAQANLSSHRTEV